MASHLPLEPLVLSFPRANLRGTAKTVLSLTHASNDKHGNSSRNPNNDEDPWAGAWVRKGAGLRVEVEGLVDGELICEEVNEKLKDGLLNAMAGRSGMDGFEE